MTALQPTFEFQAKAGSLTKVQLMANQIRLHAERGFYILDRAARQHHPDYPLEPRLCAIQQDDGVR
jgi:hypothetical protein